MYQLIIFPQKHALIRSLPANSRYRGNEYFLVTLEREADVKINLTATNL